MRAILSLVIIAVLGALALRIIQDGYSHIDIYNTFQDADVAWASGQTSHAVDLYLHGSWMTLDAGVRAQLARSWMKYTGTLVLQDKLPQALEACWTAESIAGYDDEGGWANECANIDECQKLTDCDLKERFRFYSQFW